MQSKRDLAIVLKAVTYEERSRVVTALTEQHGLVSALARNAIQSRRFGGAIDPFAASEWHFSDRPGSELASLQEAHIRRSYEGLRRDFDVLSYASAMNEVLLKVAPKNEPCPELFRLHGNALAYLEEQETTPAERLCLLNAYFAKVLQWSGHPPQLEECLECQRPLQNSTEFDALTCVVESAGWMCPQCRASSTRHVAQSFQNSFLRITPGAIQDFLISLSAPIRQAPSLFTASAHEHRGLFRFLEALFIYHMPGFEQKPLKSLRFIEPA
jgi:DNA repair protein RecO